MSPAPTMGRLLNKAAGKPPKTLLQPAFPTVINPLFPILPLPILLPQSLELGHLLPLSRFLRTQARPLRPLLSSPLQTPLWRHLLQLRPQSHHPVQVHSTLTKALDRDRSVQDPDATCSRLRPPSALRFR